VITLLVAMQGPAAKVWSRRITLRQLISDYHDPPSATSFKEGASVRGTRGPA